MHAIASRVAAKTLTLFKGWGPGAKASTSLVQKRIGCLDGETGELLRAIVSDEYHRLLLTEGEFEDLEERPFFVRALDDKLVYISAPAQAAHVSIGIRRNGYIAIGERPRFTLVDFLDGLKAALFPIKG